MAATTSQEFPSSSSSSSPCRYQVFLSFRGKDTRKNFTSHLYAALVQAGLHTFRDDDEIRTGENIESELKKAIQQSKIAIVVFSEDYASSRWCLDELVMIRDKKRTAGWKVIPVFYHVDPSDVRKQTGSFARLFTEHGKRPFEQVIGWGLALQEVAASGGMVLGEQHESEFVESIVEKVLEELNPVKVYVPCFIGRDRLMKDINSWLQSGSNDDCEIAVLYGIGGVGKTTIAKSVYNQNLDTFESISFLKDIGEKSKQPDGLLSLQRQLLYDVLKKNTSQIHDVDEGVMKIKDAICCRRILLILDDVDAKDQFKAIIGMRQWLCLGSKIIVTTRNMSLFAIHEQFMKLKVEPLDEKESIELFSWHAFGQAHPVEEFAELSKSMVRHCGGLPLALAAIGSSLCYTRTKEIWESKLREMEKILDSNVQKVLTKCYDSLHDKHQKKLFLDVACFFIGMDVDCLIQILNGLGTVDGKWRIENLINASLVEIDDSNKLRMHQIIRDMGREIAHEKSAQCQRIWDNKEAFTMLKEITDTEMVRGLTLDMHVLMEEGQRKDQNFLKRRRLSGFFSLGWLANFLSEKQAQIGQISLFPILNTAAFKKMQKIKFLQLNYVEFNGSYDHFPRSLIWLRWHGFYLRSIPKQFSLEKLVVLDMQSSSLVNAWEGKMLFPSLKILDLSHSRCLIKTPDFSDAPRLESLILKDCINLVEIHPSIGDLHGLLILNLRNCRNIEELPEEICKLDSLKALNLDGCSNLEGPSIKPEQPLQRRWSLHRDGIVSMMPHMTVMPLELFFQFWFYQKKRHLRFSTISLPRFLVDLNLSGTPIRCLPESIKDLATLKWLLLNECTMLQKVPELPTGLYTVTLDDCRSLEEVADIMFCKWTLFMNCELLEIQEWVKQDFIQRVDIHLFMLIDHVMGKIQNVPMSLEIIVAGNELNVLLRDHGGNVSRSFRSQAWVEFRLSFANQGHNNFLGFISYARLSITLPIRDDQLLFVRITNNTNGQSKHCCPKFPSTWPFYDFKLGETFDALWANCWVVDDDLVFEDGDEVNVWMYSTDPAIQIQNVSTEAVSANEDDFTELKKAQIASSIFGYFNCCLRGVQPASNNPASSTLFYSFLLKGMNN